MAIRFFLRCILVALLGSASCGAAPASDRQDITLAGRHAVYWAPVQTGAEKHPLLLFSHGYGGCATQSKFLMEALAANGYWVFAPDHADARCGRAATSAQPAYTLRTPGFRTPETWTDASQANRRDDMVALLGALRQHPDFRDRIDFSRLGLIGHSLGGYTVLGLAGAWSSWRMDGVKAVLALSPYSQPYNVKHTIADIGVPVMFQGGTRDFGTTPAVSKGSGSFEQARPPKYYVEFEGAGHFVWTDLNRRYEASVDAYSLAFLDHYVKGLPQAAALTSARPDVAALRYDSELGHGEAPAASTSRLRDRLRSRTPDASSPNTEQR